MKKSRIILNHRGGVNACITALCVIVFLVVFNQDKLYAQGQGGPPIWRLDGNPISEGDFLGTTNDMPLVFKINDTETMRLLPDGRVGIGLTNPQAQLDVDGDAIFRGWVYAENGNPNGTHSGSYQYYISSMSGNEPCKENWYFASGNDLHTSANVNFINLSTVGTRMYDGVYNAKNNITAVNVTIQSSTSVTFEAGQSIDLKPGFTAEVGSNLTAKIGDCDRGCGNGFKSTSIDTSAIEEMVISSAPYFDDEDNTQIVEQKPCQKELYLFEEEIKVYPNPNDGNFYLDIPYQKEEVVKIQIVDNLGKTVFESSLKNGNDVNIPNPQKGIYFVSVVMKDKIFTQKIIIQ